MTNQESGTENSPTATIMLKSGDSGKSVEARVGDIVAVSLDENPSTGYRWAIEQGDEQIAQMLATEYRRAAADNAIGGADSASSASP